MSDKIRVRSPYYLRYSDLNFHYVEVQLWVLPNGQTPSSAAFYTINKYEVGTSNYAVVEISELVRDYLDQYTEFDGNYNTTNNRPNWVRVQSKIYNSATPPVQQGTTSTELLLAFDGYSYFEDGINQLISDTQYFLTDATKLRKPDGESITVAINAEAVDNVGGLSCTAAFWNNGSKVLSTEVVIATSGSIPDSQNAATKVDFVSSGANDVDEVRIYRDDTINDPVLLASIPVITQDCSKYDATKLTFINKYGVLQDLFFFSKTVKTLKVEGEEYKASNLTLNTSPPSYDTYKHQYTTFDKQGKESIVLNTGLVGEEYNEPMRQLMLSEKVWMTEGSTVYPVKVKTTNFREKTSLNDKVFNYTIELEYAFDKVQNIR
jgi:hypothetical protein